jgi:8-oxo-dGTP pyrophosphatase MutT (NUDIX family)
MSRYEFTVHLKNAFGNLYRKHHALIVVRDPNGNYLFGQKPKFYPPGIVRLIGGGVNENESPNLGATRELNEELKITVDQKDVLPLSDITFHAITPKNTLHLTTHLYFYQLHTADYIPGDDITGISILTLDQIRELSEKFNRLPTDLWDPDHSFTWDDYGRVYGPIHLIAYEETKKLLDL